MWSIIIFLISHWFLSLFLHSFFLHRFASHRLYNTSKGWERFFYLSTWFVQGSSYLVPRAYAVLHRMHHTYSDTEKDPHSPHFFKDIVQMMLHTAAVFSNFVRGVNVPDEQFTREYLPMWDRLDKIGNSIAARLVFGIGYVIFYVFLAPNAWWFLLLPLHFTMGPLQGAIVNWCGHKYGYQNYDNADHSRNSSPFGVFLMGELFQNNHHHQKDNPNFARKWFEFDMTYIIMKGLHRLSVIRLIPVEQTPDLKHQ